MFKSFVKRQGFSIGGDCSNDSYLGLVHVVIRGSDNDFFTHDPINGSLEDNFGSPGSHRGRQEIKGHIPYFSMHVENTIHNSDHFVPIHRELFIIF